MGRPTGQVGGIREPTRVTRKDLLPTQFYQRNGQPFCCNKPLLMWGVTEGIWGGKSRETQDECLPMILFGSLSVNEPSPSGLSMGCIGYRT